jgi:uncharacterized phage protein (TIGR01671 family)
MDTTSSFAYVENVDLYTEIMREIKFRAWRNGEMTTMFNLTSQGIIKEYPRLGQPYLSLDINDALLMQYTGLKDKNRKEIYEGDIVSVEETFHPNGKTYRGKVVYLSDIATINTPGFFLSTKQGIMSMILGEYKVIGNIHENPELL